jgi:hypothetical protein
MQPGQSQQNDSEDFLFGGKPIPSLKWQHPVWTPNGKPVGSVQGGTICQMPYKQQRTEMVTNKPGEKGKVGKPRFFENGDPMMQLVVPVQTDERDPSMVADDGVRAIYIAYPNDANLRTAMLEVGARKLEIGGVLLQRWVSGAGNAGDGRVYEFKYTPPANVQNWDAHPQPVPVVAAPVQSPAPVTGGWNTAQAMAAPVQAVTHVAGPPTTSVSGGSAGNGWGTPAPAPQPVQAAAPGGWGQPAPVAAPVPQGPPRFDAATWAILNPQQKAEYADRAPLDEPPY